MPNPTGTVYLTENPGYVWSDGDVYEIAQTDTVEGAGVGASFSGLGVDNQPHQLLLNKVKLVRTNQVTDEANIATLQAFTALLTGTIGVNGYVAIPFHDTVKGQIQLIVQWGTISLLGQSPANLKNAAFSQNFPYTFPNACYGEWATWQTNDTTSNALAFANCMIMLEVKTPYARNAITVATDYDNGTASVAGGTGGTINIATTATDGNGITGIQWMAWGW